MNPPLANRRHILPARNAIRFSGVRFRTSRSPGKHNDFRLSRRHLRVTDFFACWHNHLCACDLHQLRNQGGELIRGFGQASQYTRGRLRVAFFLTLLNPARIARIKRSPSRARPTMLASKRMSASTSANVRGFMAKKFRGCSSSFATVSCLYGTEPITNVGRRAKISLTPSMCQQSPSCGSPATGATSTHHFVTPTSEDFAPIAHKMDVALGASDTIRSFFRSSFFFIAMRENTRPLSRVRHDAPLVAI